MSTTMSRTLQEEMYEREAQAYLLSLPLEHFMESVPQATQRTIALESLDLVKAQRDDVHVFNELLVQYPVADESETGKVVPDNMVVISSKPFRAVGSYNIPFEPAKPFWVMEYVSPNNPGKDYEDSFEKYEKHLKVPYYLIFDPDTQELILYKHNQRKYEKVVPNGHGRYEIPELEMEVAVLDGWVRFWYQGNLLPLPAELQSDLDETRRLLIQEKKRADEQSQRADRAEADKRRADEERQRIEAAKRQAEERADELQKRLAEAERKLAALGQQTGEPPPVSPT